MLTLSSVSLRNSHRIADTLQPGHLKIKITFASHPVNKKISQVIVSFAPVVYQSCTDGDKVQLVRGLIHSGAVYFWQFRQQTLVE